MAVQFSDFPDSNKAYALNGQLFKEYVKATGSAKLNLRNLLVQNNLRLVYAAVAKVAKLGLMDVKDLEQEGSLILILCVEKFNPDRGVCFSTYASPMIERRLLNVVRKKAHAIRIPRGAFDYVQDGKRAEKRLASKLGRLPSEREIAAEIGISVDSYRKSKEAFNSCRQPLQIPRQLKSCSSTFSRREVRGFSISIDSLNSMEHICFRMFFLDRRSLSSIAARLRIQTAQEVKAMLAKILEKIDVEVIYGRSA